jgi:putative spermidine/putrescine transport system ATP-binding protein
VSLGSVAAPTSDPLARERLALSEELRAAAPAGVPIVIRGLVQSLGGQRVLQGVDLDVAPGEFLTLLGASGSGKTTLLMALAGFNLPDEGQIVVGGEDITIAPPHRRNIGVVFQSYALFPHMTVGGNIAYPLKLRGLPRAEIETRVREALELVHLGGFENRSVASLSGGQRQRTAVARAIVFRPRILLMDEPLSALDKPLREALQLELRRLHKDLGLTTIYVTHDQREAISLSDRIALMRAGRIDQIGAPRELYERPRNAFVARFLGDSTILALDRRADGFYYRDQRIEPGAGAAPAGRVGLLARPEKLRLARGEAGELRLSGTVADVIYEGGGYRLEVRLDDGASLSARDPIVDSARAERLRRGTPVDIALAPADAVLLALDE